MAVQLQAKSRKTNIFIIIVQVVKVELVKSFANDEPNRLSHGAMVVTGEAAMFVGIGCLGAGIPLYCVGKHRIKKTGSEYNVSKGYPDVALKVGSTGNGFGLSLNF